MKKKNHRKKALTAVGAVVAAGLTPGIIGATPVQDPSPELTAAEVVAIDGNTFGFDELYAMQQPASGSSRSANPQVATRYGVMPTQPATSYGVPRPQRPPVHVTPVDRIQMRLLEYCARQIDADSKVVMISLDSDLSRDLKMSDDQLKELATMIEELYGVKVSYYRFYLKGQLNTLRLVSEYIYKYRAR